MSSKPVPEGHYVKLPNRHRIHYLDKGKGPVLVWLHGSGSGACGHSNFKGNYPYFADNGYRNIVIDHLGYGYSDKPDNIEYPIELFVECVKQTLDQIGLSHYSLIGNSLGGAVALRFALDHPHGVDKLVLMAPGGIENQPDYFLMPAMATMKEVFMSATPVTEERLRYFFEEAMVVDKKFIDQPLVHERFELMKLQNPQVIKTMKVPNMADRLGEIGCPALGFWGMNEKLMPETGILKLAKGMPNMRMVLVPKAGHWVMIEHRDLFNRTTLDFLKNG
jgi:4,5:9,10-diseco-3-hydroxy-5,9,17-trioxoandrosta-1(10),2-diene-4-oate hydrolase